MITTWRLQAPSPPSPVCPHCPRKAASPRTPTPPTQMARRSFLISRQCLQSQSSSPSSARARWHSGTPCLSSHPIANCSHSTTRLRWLLLREPQAWPDPATSSRDAPSCGGTPWNPIRFRGQRKANPLWSASSALGCSSWTRTRTHSGKSRLELRLTPEENRPWSVQGKAWILEKTECKSAFQMNLSALWKQM